MNPDFEIRWVETPRCTDCNGGKAMRNRPQCAGCQKLRAHPRPTAPAVHGRLRTRLQARRDREIDALHRDGKTLRQIAELLGIPRSTVNNAVQRNARKSCGIPCNSRSDIGRAARRIG